MFPFSYWILMAVVVGLILAGSKSEKVLYVDENYYTRISCSTIALCLTAALLVYFSSQTIANDVWSYRFSYTHGSFSLSLSELFDQGTGSNPLFHYMQALSKEYLHLDAASFQFLCALIIQTLFLLFYKRYSPQMSLSVFMFIASGLFYFTCVSWKQSLAMAIGLTLIPFAEKKQWKFFFCLLFITMFMHPYIIMYGMLYLLINDKVWTKKNIAIIIGMCIAGYALSSILGLALEVTENVFGDQHDAQYFDTEHGISLPRVIFFSITPVLSWIYRKRLDERPYPLMNGFIQMSVISFGFYLMSLSGGANFISRMGTYFEPFTYVALPYILTQVIPQNKRTLYTIVVIVMFLVFFSFLQLKRGSLF